MYINGVQLMTKISDCIQLSGVLNQNNTDQLLDKVNELLSQKVRIILIDMKDVSFMTSSGIGALVAALKTVHALGGELYICSLSEQAKTIFDLTKMGHIFKPLENRQEFEDKVLAQIR